MDLIVKEQKLTTEQVALIKDTICRDSTDSELKLFLHLCEKTRLDPFAKQIYAIKRWDSDLNRKVMSTQVSVDGLRLVAERTGKYKGQKGPYWCGSDGKWVDVWLDKAPPMAAKVGVFKDGFSEPLYAVAKFESYAQRTKAGDLNSFWKKFGDHMLAKCAESLALRKAFPQELSGLYTTEEMPPVNEPEILPPAAPEQKLIPTEPAHKNSATVDSIEKMAPHEDIGYAQPEPKPIPPEYQKWNATDKQLTRLFAIARANGYTDETGHELIQTRYGVDSTRKLTRQQYDDCCEYMQKYKAEKG